jgi:hypothetical protein
MTWETVLPRLCSLLDLEGYLVILNRHTATPWDDALRPIIAQYSTNLDYQPYDLVEELVQRDLFAPAGKLRTTPLAFEQPIDDYIESFHSRNGFSRERMGAEQAAAFDREMRALTAPSELS